MENIAQKDQELARMISEANGKVEAAIAGIPCAIQQIHGIQIDTSNMPKINVQPIPKFSIPAGYMEPKRSGYQSTHIHVEPFNS